MLHLKIVGLEQDIAYLFYVATVTLENPLSILLRFVKEHFCFVTEYHLIIR